MSLPAAWHERRAADITRRRATKHIGVAFLFMVDAMWRLLFSPMPASVSSYEYSALVYGHGVYIGRGRPDLEDQLLYSYISLLIKCQYSPIYIDIN